MARQYDAIYDDPYWEFHDRLTWQAIRAYLPTDLAAACCDIGCGTGKWGLKILKSGYATTFIDHAGSMIEQVRAKLTEMGAKEKKATLLAADMVDLSMVADDSFTLIVAMGDPLSICSDAAKAAREMYRLSRPGGIVIATADNKLAALDHYMANGSFNDLEEFVHTSRTQWLTKDEREKFTLTTFTPTTLRKLFEQAGFAVIEVLGKTILPVRRYKEWLENEESFDRLLRLERRLSEDASSAATAAHLQIIARKAPILNS